jgi:hypothetical protein
MRQRIEPSRRIFESSRVASQAKKLTVRTKLGKKWRERLTFPQFDWRIAEVINPGGLPLHPLRHLQKASAEARQPAEGDRPA